MSIWQRLVILCGAVLTLAACQSTRVVTDFDPGADFSSWRAYSWQQERSGVSEEFNPLLAKRVQEAVAAALAAKGFREENASPDFIVRYFVNSSAQVREPNARGSVGLGSFGRNVGMGVSLGFPLGGTSVTQHAEIVIDFINPQTNSLAWRGTRDVTLRSEDPHAVTEQVQAAVNEIIGQFPPQSVK